MNDVKAGKPRLRFVGGSIPSGKPVARDLENSGRKPSPLCNSGEDGACLPVGRAARRGRKLRDRKQSYTHDIDTAYRLAPQVSGAILTPANYATRRVRMQIPGPFKFTPVQRRPEASLSRLAALLHASRFSTSHTTAGPQHPPSRLA